MSMDMWLHSSSVCVEPNIIRYIYAMNITWCRRCMLTHPIARVVDHVIDYSSYSLDFGCVVNDLCPGYFVALIQHCADRENRFPQQG